MKHKKLTFLFKANALTEEGTFEGDLSVYDIVDLGGDSVIPGAFSKSLKENAGRVPLLWQHDPSRPIGYLDLTDSTKSLKAKGTLLIEDVPQAREAHALLKAGVLKGLSIGYETVKDTMEKGVRKLLEVKLWEGSIVTFPMLPAAQVSAVKANEEKSVDFEETLAALQTYAARGQSLDALYSTLSEILWDFEDQFQTAADRVQASATAIDNFRVAYLDAIAGMLTLYGVKSLPELIKTKAGRRLSAATREKLEGALSSIQTLLGEADEAETEEAVKSQGKPSDQTLIEQLKYANLLMEVSCVTGPN